MLLLSLSCLLPPLPDSRPYGSRIASQSLRSHRRVIISKVSRSFCSIEFPNAEFADILQNKVLFAAAISGAIGQLSKPFTSSIRRGSSLDLDFRKALQSGGFPSTHSSAAVAAATTLGFERGFSDSIYGLAVVYACLTMYDAQGVRREVGVHAKCLNKVLTEEKLKPIVDGDEFTDSFPRNPSDYVEKLGSFESAQPNETVVLVESADSTTAVKRELERSSIDFSPLKESVGHTETEVIAGALLGFFVSLALCVI